ncbi:ABC transporter permease [Nocardioides sp. MAH-18]|uniref:Transport permease protein n=1 Tax=Nocardioides agri TaxID=2682843 RepID=A0A6L6XW53_9ACTN|nr:ABC transporter permease [Nocardioides sp. CGMCC 1.13656]MVQ50937.1 ABC transporter permease [Nocardioides sp. MAH-18]
MMRGFFRDRAAVFFAIVFPLMFLVLFGSLFSEDSSPRVEMVQVGAVPLFDDLSDEARAAFDETFEVSHSDDLDAAIDEVRTGDANVAVVQEGDTIVAHYTLADPAGAAITRGAMQAFVDGANLAATGQPPTYSMETDPVEDESIDAIQYYMPSLLGWAIAMSAAFGAAATLQGWRKSKLLRRLQLAPVSSTTVVGARVSVTVSIALVQMAIFIGTGALLFDLTLTGDWWMAIPLVVVGTLCFMAVGLLAAAITKSQEGAVNAANFIVLPMAMLSGTFFPLEGAPQWLQSFAQILPLKHLNEGMLDVMVRGEPWTAALGPMLYLAAFATVVTLVAARLFRWETA